MKNIKIGTIKEGYQVVWCRFRKVRGKSGKVLDAHEYGYKAWCFFVRIKKQG